MKDVTVFGDCGKYPISFSQITVETKKLFFVLPEHEMFESIKYRAEEQLRQNKMTRNRWLHFARIGRLKK